MSRGRWIDVAPERIGRWVATFADRHGATQVRMSTDLADTVELVGSDGVVAQLQAPFPPFRPPCEPRELGPALAGHATRPRVIGVLLARLGGYAVGVFDGQRLLASKVGTRQVHARSAAGGWSQRRFQRRRDLQARRLLDDAADVAVRVLDPYALDAVVLGGDRRAVQALRADPRLRGVFDKAVDRFLTVPDPRLVVLRDSPRLFRAVRARLVELDRCAG